jgi:hypothetical protein
MAQECPADAKAVGGWWLARTNHDDAPASRRSVCFVCSGVFAELVGKGPQFSGGDDYHLWSRYRVLRSLGSQEEAVVNSCGLVGR